MGRRKDEPDMKIKVAQVKVVPAKGDLAANAGVLQDVLGRIAPHRPDVVITPEGFLEGYVVTEESVSREKMADYAIDPAESYYARDVAAWAGENRCWMVLGCARKAGGDVYNTALIFSRDGELAGWYDKVHLQRHDLKYAPGDALGVFESDFGRFGVMICADRRWPETVRTLALKGAHVIFNPTYGMSCDLNEAMMRTRAYENDLFIVFTHPKQSLVTGPDGAIVHNSRNDAESFTLTEIDLSAVEEIRAPDTLSHLRSRRPDVYEL